MKLKNKNNEILLLVISFFNIYYLFCHFTILTTKKIENKIKISTEEIINFLIQYHLLKS